MATRFLNWDKRLVLGFSDIQSIEDIDVHKNIVISLSSLEKAKIKHPGRIVVSYVPFDGDDYVL